MLAVCDLKLVNMSAVNMSANQCSISSQAVIAFPTAGKIASVVAS
jgi:hypothetical protein